jgi:hypothetical protein
MKTQAAEITSKSAKAQDVLAKRKAEAAKTTLPPIAEKSSKLLKVNENLIRRKIEAAKVAATEREKKKAHDPSPVLELEKKTISKRKLSNVSEQEKHVVAIEEPHESVGPAEKRREWIRSRRLIKKLIFCRLPKLSLRLVIPQKGKNRR